MAEKGLVDRYKLGLKLGEGGRKIRGWSQVRKGRTDGWEYKYHDKKRIFLTAKIDLEFDFESMEELEAMREIIKKQTKKVYEYLKKLNVP